jgi:nicotinamidase/pyrazinamidase
VLWPVHCVAGTHGAAFAAELDTARFDAVVRKGMDPEIDSYSGFFDNDRQRATGLADRLRELGETELWVLGLATDYCVKATALDALRLGFRTTLVVDGCRAVELQAGDGARAIAELQAAGVTLVTSGELLAGASAGR